MRIDTGRLRVVGSETLEPAQSDDGAPPSPGAYIREHRERRGMSLEELAVATKVPKDSLGLVEADRFDELPGMVFAKGFLRCCARVLELDEDTVLGLLYELERMAPNERDKRGARARRDSQEGLIVPASQVPSRPVVQAREREELPVHASVESAAELAPLVGEQGPDSADGGQGEAMAALSGAKTSGLGEGESREKGAQGSPGSAPDARDKREPLFDLRSIALPKWALRLRDRLTAPRLLLWLLVAAFVVLIVFLAFTIASGQHDGSLRL